MSLCCTNQRFIGCFGSCESIETGIIAALTGDYIITAYWLGNQIEQTVNITATNEIIFPNVYSECAAITFKITDPNGDTVVDGSDDCFTFSNMVKITA